MFRPVSVAAYPEQELGLVVLDYGFGPEITDYLVAITFDADGRVVDVSLES